MKQLLDVQITIMDRQAKIEFDEAMAECQAEMADVRIIKNATNKQTNSSYANHEIICAAIKPIYTRHGFRLSFSEGKAEIESEIRITCAVTHKKGHTEKFWIDLPADGAGIKGSVNKTPIHAKGSTFSYGRRYLTLMIFDLATYDDNDGNQSGNQNGSQSEPQAQVKTLPCYPEKLFKENKKKWKKLIESGNSSAPHIVQMVGAKYTLSTQQKLDIANLAPKGNE
jgi:hypothetical protein